MKSLVRLSATLGLVGSTLIGSLLIGGMQALALPEQQVIEKLGPVPVFTIADSEGAPLVAAPRQEGGDSNTSVAGVFISRQDAQNFLNNLRTENPELANNVQVVPVSLAEVYQLAQTSRSQENRLEFAFVPVEQQVRSALSLLQQSGQNAEEFEGVPIFIARAGTDGGYLTIQQGEQQVIPLFFSREELQTMLDRFRQQQPSAAANTNIQVVNLEGVIETLRTSNNQQLNQIVLVPPRESVEFIRSLQPAQGQRPAAQPNATQNRPATPAPRQ